MASVPADLARERMLDLTTMGRKSGQPRKTKIWFVAEGDRVFVQAGPKGLKGWYANLKANPAVSLSIRGRTFEGMARPLTEERDTERVVQLVRHKYWLARVAGWLGSKIGHGKPVEIELTDG